MGGRELESMGPFYDGAISHEVASGGLLTGGEALAKGLMGPFSGRE